MERIAKALEVARIHSDASWSANEPPRIPDRTVGTGASSGRVAAQMVQYSQTRRVQVSPDALRDNLVTGGHERTPVAEAFKRIRTQVVQRMRETGANTLGIASPRSGEGKTTVALNLAVHAAMEPDWTVLVVEADVRHPGLSKALGLGIQPGLSDYLLNETPLEELLVDPGLGRCILLPAGKSVPGSSEAIGSSRMRDLVQELKVRYPDRIVIFDLPPLLDSADGIAVLPWVESLLLVVEEGRTATEDVLRSAQLVGNDRLIGTVLNKSSVGMSVPGSRPGFFRRLLTGAQ
jgi:Mrp family chromosome partitioning ATPase